MRAADAIVRTLAEAGVSHVFGIPGIHTLALHDALLDEPRIRHVGTRTEGAATHAADGYARVSGQPGVVLVTSGVATFYTLGPLSEADLDGSPLLVLAGQVPSTRVGRGWGVLHETDDQAAAFAPAAGFIARPRTAEALVEAVADALAHLRAPFARPAYVEMPTDLLEVDVGAADGWTAARPAADSAGPPQSDLARAAAILGAARRPVMLAGGAVVAERATGELVALAEALAAPVLLSVPGLGSIAAGHPLDAGVLVPGRGSGPTLLAEADAILVAGDRLDEVSTGGWSLAFGGPVVQLHPRAEWLDRGVPAEVAIAGPVRPALAALRAALEQEARHERREGRRERATAAAAEARDSLRRSVRDEARPWLAMVDELRASLPPETIMVSDAAALDTWSGYFWPVPAPATSLFPWGSAALGFSVPAAIGASLAAPDAPVIVFLGDGGFAYVAMELATARQAGANVIIVVADDGGYRSIGDYQLARYRRTSGVELGGTDLLALAASFGVPARRVESVADLPSAVGTLREAGGPALVQLTERVVPPWSRTEDDA